MKVRNYLLDFVGIHKYCRHKAEIQAYTYELYFR